MPTPYAPSSQAPIDAAAPTITPGFARTNAEGRWVWSDTGPEEAGVITNAQGRLQLDVGEPGTWIVLLGTGGSPVIIGG